MLVSNAYQLTPLEVDTQYEDQTVARVSYYAKVTLEASDYFGGFKAIGADQVIQQLQFLSAIPRYGDTIAAAGLGVETNSYAVRYNAFLAFPGRTYSPGSVTDWIVEVTFGPRQVNQNEESEFWIEFIPTRYETPESNEVTSLDASSLIGTVAGTTSLPGLPNDEPLGLITVEEQVPVVVQRYRSATLSGALSWNQWQRSMNNATWTVFGRTVEKHHAVFMNVQCGKKVTRSQTQKRPGVLPTNTKYYPVELRVALFPRPAYNFYPLIGRWFKVSEGLYNYEYINGFPNPYTVIDANGALASNKTPGFVAWTTNEERDFSLLGYPTGEPD